jgi:hypothetical protein
MLLLKHLRNALTVKASVSFCTPTAPAATLHSVERDASYQAAHHEIRSLRSRA